MYTYISAKQTAETPDMISKRNKISILYIPIKLLQALLLGRSHIKIIICLIIKKHPKSKIKTPPINYNFIMQAVF